MKLVIALFSTAMILAGTLVARADGPTFSNGIIGKIFDWKSTHGARAAGLEKFPGCDDPKVLGKIVERYNWAENHTWQRGFDLDDITRTRERQTLAGGDRLINRRFCRGHAHLSNGRHPTVHYLIEQRQGFASMGWNVEFCISGHDSWMAFDDSCRILRR